MRTMNLMGHMLLIIVVQAAWKLKKTIKICTIQFPVHRELDGARFFVHHFQWVRPFLFTCALTPHVSANMVSFPLFCSISRGWKWMWYNFEETFLTFFCKFKFKY